MSIDVTYSIGEVAQRFGIAPSTLRWWEKCGLVEPSGRESGRRRYNDADVRRIALIQLWQTTATMSLDEIAALLHGATHDRDWRDAVRSRIAECDSQLERLTKARANLVHMLRCTSDHPVQECPYLAREVDRYLASVSR